MADPAQSYYNYTISTEIIFLFETFVIHFVCLSRIDKTKSICYMWTRHTTNGIKPFKADFKRHIMFIAQISNLQGIFYFKSGHVET